VEIQKKNKNEKEQVKKEAYLLLYPERSPHWPVVGPSAELRTKI
jgi:hypothetical protein